MPPFKITRRAEEAKEGAEEFRAEAEKYASEGFTVEAWRFIKCIRKKAERMKDYPLQLILIEVSKSLLLSEFELLFLSYYVEKDGWFVEAKVISEYERRLRLEGWPEADNPTFRSIFLYFLVTSYCVKYYLNNKIEALTQHLSAKYLPDFKAFFELYAKARAEDIFKIDPRELNLKFKESMVGTGSTSELRDFNQLVYSLCESGPEEDDYPRRDSLALELVPGPSFIYR